MHRTGITAIGIAAGGIVPDSSRARSKPHLKRVEEDPVRIIRIHRDSLVVPVLRVIAGAVSAVSKRAALRALHKSPGRATVCRSPGTQLAASSIAAAAVVIRGDGLALCVDVIWVTRRNADVDSSELVAGRRTDICAAAAGIHGRPRRVRAAGNLIAEDEPIGVAGD